MKNDFITNPPEIKRNLFTLTKKSKKDINNIIPKSNDQIKKINDQKKRMKQNSHEKNNYLNLNSSVSGKSSLKDLIKLININNNYKTNINREKDDILLTDRLYKDKIDRIKIKNENQTLNLSKNVEEIIKRRINEKNIQKIKNKVKKININKQKQTKLSKSKTTTLKEFKKLCSNNDNNNKIKNEEKNIDENNIINKKQRNKFEKNELNIIEEEKLNEKYFETRRLSNEWAKDEKKD